MAAVAVTLLRRARCCYPNVPMHVDAWMRQMRPLCANCSLAHRLRPGLTVQWHRRHPAPLAPVAWRACTPPPCTLVRSSPARSNASSAALPVPPPARPALAPLHASSPLHGPRADEAAKDRGQVGKRASATGRSAAQLCVEQSRASQLVPCCLAIECTLAMPVPMAAVAPLLPLLPAAAAAAAAQALRQPPLPVLGVS